MTPVALTFYAGICGWTLARAHAGPGIRSPSPAYLGDTTRSTNRSPASPERYADQNERDYQRSSTRSGPDGWKRSRASRDPAGRACGRRRGRRRSHVAGSLRGSGPPVRGGRPPQCGRTNPVNSEPARIRPCQPDDLDELYSHLPADRGQRPGWYVVVPRPQAAGTRLCGAVCPLRAVARLRGPGRRRCGRSHRRGAGQPGLRAAP